MGCFNYEINTLQVLYSQKKHYSRQITTSKIIDDINYLQKNSRVSNKGTALMHISTYTAKNFLDNTMFFIFIHPLSVFITTLSVHYLEGILSKFPHLYIHKHYILIVF